MPNPTCSLRDEEYIAATKVYNSRLATLIEVLSKPEKYKNPLAKKIRELLDKSAPVSDGQHRHHPRK